MHMKKPVSVLLLLALMLCLSAGAFAQAPEPAPLPPLVTVRPAPDVDVAAVFAQKNNQPFTRESGRIVNLDSIWIYFTDGTFDQFVLIDDLPVLFSQGNYRFENGGSFIFAPDAKDFGDIVISRTMKYDALKGLVPYESEHTYALNTLGFNQLYPGKDVGKKLVAFFVGPAKQPFRDGMIDSYWLYFDDSSFRQFACVLGSPIPFSEGTYALADGSSFNYEEDESDFGQITITRTMKFQEGKNYAAYASEHTYELNTLGFSLLILDQD